jgi:hypothetical protein
VDLPVGSPAALLADSREDLPAVFLAALPAVEETTTFRCILSG